MHCGGHSFLRLRHPYVLLFVCLRGNVRSLVFLCMSAIPSLHRGSNVGLYNLHRVFVMRQRTNLSSIEASWVYLPLTPPCLTPATVPAPHALNSLYLSLDRVLPMSLTPSLFLAPDCPCSFPVYNTSVINRNRTRVSNLS